MPAILVHTSPMAGLDDLAATVTALRQAIDCDRDPLSPRLKPFKSALTRLDPASAPKSAIKRPPMPAVPARSRHGRRTRR